MRNKLPLLAMSKMDLQKEQGGLEIDKQIEIIMETINGRAVDELVVRN